VEEGEEPEEEEVECQKVSGYNSWNGLYSAGRLGKTQI